jgi:AmmeMemoRadiSam system protein B
MYTVRQPAVAGTFYPASKERLQHAVQELLAAARRDGGPALAAAATAKALIVPHAGYIYSGSTAALA